MLLAAWLGLVLVWPSTPAWTLVRPGLERSTFTLASSGLRSHIQVIALRLDPCRVRLSLMDRTGSDGMRNAWTVDSLPRAAMLAMNAGQFRGTRPWGWYVRDGMELQPPGTGPLAMAVTFDAEGGVALLTPTEVMTHRGQVRQAFESYPTLLVDGELPMPLRASGRGVDLDHRDSRLAMGVTADRSVIIAFTRFEGQTGTIGTIPYGPTIVELASVMRMLGAIRAVGLDGGLSSQLALRDANGKVTNWTNWRKVPIGIIGTASEGCEAVSR